MLTWADPSRPSFNSVKANPSAPVYGLLHLLVQIRHQLLVVHFDGVCVTQIYRLFSSYQIPLGLLARSHSHTILGARLSLGLDDCGRCIIVIVPAFSLF